jgi:trk system potassium uptake protein TrkA
MNVLVIGGGQVGGHLASLLRADGHTVTVVEPRPDVAGRVRREAPGATALVASGVDPAALEAAGVRRADVVAAVAGTDETNLAATSLARFEFGVPRTIARVNDPRHAWLFGPEMGVDVALSQADLLAHLIAEELSLGDMTTLLKLRRGQYSLVEERVHPRAPAAGREVRALDLPAACVLVAVIRRGHLLLPRPEAVLEPEDEVLALVHTDAAGALATLLGAPPTDPPPPGAMGGGAEGP